MERNITIAWVVRFLLLCDLLRRIKKRNNTENEVTDDIETATRDNKIYKHNIGHTDNIEDNVIIKVDECKISEFGSFLNSNLIGDYPFFWLFINPVDRYQESIYQFIKLKNCPIEYYRTTNIDWDLLSRVKINSISKYLDKIEMKDSVGYKGYRYNPKHGEKLYLDIKKEGFYNNCLSISSNLKYVYRRKYPIKYNVFGLVATSAFLFTNSDFDKLFDNYIKIKNKACGIQKL